MQDEGSAKIFPSVRSSFIPFSTYSSATSKTRSTFFRTTGKHFSPGMLETRASATVFTAGTCTRSPAARLALYRGSTAGSAP